MLQEVNKTKFEGFSYIEILIVLGIFSIASFFFLPFSLSQLSASRVSYHAADVNSLAFGTQQNAFSQKNGSDHGIRFNTDDFDVFEGASYATSTSSYNVDLDNSVEFTDVDLELVGTSTSTTELVFDRGEFKPNADGSITLSDGAQSYTLYINEEGLIYYEKD